MFCLISHAHMSLHSDTQLTASSDLANSDLALSTAHEVIQIEMQALLAMKQKLCSNFSHACHLMSICPGRVIVIGMGKSGHIGQKIAATLASTGTPSFFVHPGEASHGDMGMITSKDTVLALSYSGETQELIAILPRLRALGVPLIAMTGRTHSTLAEHAKVTLDTSVPKEACPLGLAPTSSTTNCIVLGDALAIALLKQRGFTTEDFAKAHPGGHLGRRLLTQLKDIMHTTSAIPSVFPEKTLAQASLEMTHKRLGMTCVVDSKSSQLLGVFTDGDLRRALEQGIDLHSTQIQSVMITAPLTAHAAMLATEAMRLMQEHRITTLIVIHPDQTIAGIVHLHDLLSIGMDPST
ncbi:MAG: D-arabinose 5-phosphate isomerase [Legionellales bacterium]|nr:D-arabinose 5-phosphate isomerase [Legionellales bacterium]